MRKRRSNRAAHPARLDQSVVLFRGLEPGETQVSGRYVSITLRMAREMIESGEAEQIEVASADNGTFIAYLETETGVQRRTYRRRQVRDVSCSMGPRVTEMAAQGVEKYCVLVAIWSNGRQQLSEVTA